MWTLLLYVLSFLWASQGVSIDPNKDEPKLILVDRKISVPIAPVPAIIEADDLPEESPEQIWSHFRDLIPRIYYELALEKGLHRDPEFQSGVFNLVLQQLAVQMDTQYAKQTVLHDYVLCSCPANTCGRYELDDLDDDFREDMKPFFVTLKPGEDFGSAMRILRLVKYSLTQIQYRHKYVADMVDCSCPHAELCRSSLSPDVFAIVAGAKDAFLTDTYWQGVFRESSFFPNIVPEKLFAQMQEAWNTLLNNIFGGGSSTSTGQSNWGWFGNIIPWVIKNKTEPATVPSYFASAFGGPENVFGGIGDAFVNLNSSEVEIDEPRIENAAKNVSGLFEQEISKKPMRTNLYRLMIKQ